jgi:hypothetical protein
MADFVRLALEGRRWSDAGSGLLLTRPPHPLSQRLFGISESRKWLRVSWALEFLRASSDIVGATSWLGRSPSRTCERGEHEEP